MVMGFQSVDCDGTSNKIGMGRSGPTRHGLHVDANGSFVTTPPVS
jgi:hypothetical protein